VDRPRRILVVAACPFPVPRGTPIRIQRLTQALARRGHDLHVATYHLGGSPADPGFAIHRIADVPGYTRTAPGPTPRKLLQLDLLLARLVRRLSRDRRFDVVHAHHYEGLLVALAVRGTAPVVYDAHTTLAGELAHYRLGLPRPLLRSIGAALDRALPGRAAHTVAVSETIRRRLLAIGAVPAERISVVPNGVEWRSFDPRARRTPPGENLIFTGNLAEYQGVDLMLEAFALLRRRRPEARLRIVSDMPFDAFERQAKGLGVREAIEVRAASFEEQPALLAEADVALNPRTECDGIPQKLLNYMAAAMPIVSCDGSAVHLVHERTGLRVPNGRPGAMAEAIDRLLGDRALARRLGQAAREQVRQEFSWERAAERVEAVYRTLS
jgi:glycosyltransferase involved in cell wall biosynthesis